MRLSSAAGHLSTGPAVFGYAAVTKRGLARSFRFPLVQREVQSEDAIQVRPSEVHAGAHHADFITDAKPVASAERVGMFAVSGKLVAEHIVDDDRLPPAVEQSLAAVQLRRKQQERVATVHRDLFDTCRISTGERRQHGKVLDSIAQKALVPVEDLSLPEQAAQSLGPA